MNLFPTLVVDNFYDNVDAVRELALSLSFDVSENSYPGKRTKGLHEVAPKFFEYSCNKLFSLYYDYYTPVKWNVATSFQLIDPYDTDPLNVKNLGWIHKDINAVFAGVIYLTPDANPDSGTRIYKIKDGISEEEANNTQHHSHKLYGDNKIDDDYLKAIKTHKSHFEETINVKNYYNRLITFDSNSYHGVETVYSESSRLTQVFFVTEVNAASKPPISRMNSYTFIK